MTKYLNITETGQKLVEWSEQMTDEPIIITKEGQPIMVALNYAQIESWLETLDILQDKEFAEILSEAITWEDAKKQLGW
ncbi:MAG: prevent-host-death protein [Microcystis aeruginosa SX13-01]|nr:prevent-host-death protein [Microcystis aeruginosa SX13-01]